MKPRRFSRPTVPFAVCAVLLLQAQAQPPPGMPPAAVAAEPAESAAPVVPTMPAQPAIPADPAEEESYETGMTTILESDTGLVETDGQLYSFKFEGADLDTVMETYCEWTGQTYLKNDAVKATITLKAADLSKGECVHVIEAILGMNNIALVPMGDKFIKVVQANAPDLVGQGVTVNLDMNHKYEQTDKLVSQIIQLKNVQIGDVQTAVQHLMHAYGKIQTLERSNCLMVTDTEANIIRIRELLTFIDQASASIEPRIYEIKFADATEIAAKLTEIITMAQEDQQQTTARGTVARPPGIVRARSTTPTARPVPTQATISKTESSANLIITGNVKVLADERTNIIFIFSQQENFEFFDKIIKVLDVEVDPAITFEVVNLEYADAEELAGTLNELVGAATGTGGRGSTSSTSSRTTGTTSRSTGVQRPSSTSRSSSSRSSSSSSSRARLTPNASPAASIENLSRLSEETRILADMRSNSVLLMGQKADIAALKEVIKQLDVMLEQVVIEAAIFEVGLGDELRHGIDWLYRAAGDEKIGAWDGSSVITNSIENVVSGALSYYQFFPDIDSQMLINISQTDTDARLISTPVIMTTDNTEATLSIGEQRPVVTSTDTYSSSLGGQRSNYEYKDIGIQLTVTPRINPQRFVVMEVTQRADQIGTIVTIDNNEVPTILNREFEASIAVPDGGTVVLGGLVSTDVSDTVNKIPLLGDIPLIGRYLFSSVAKTETQRELIVLMTPYVMTNIQEMTGQTKRLYEGTSLKQEDWGKNNWSESPLREIPDPEEETPEENQ